MSLLDPKWKYTHSTATDIRKTFAKARRELARKTLAKMARPKLRLVPDETSTEPRKGDGLAVVQGQ
jgi:hypothetical protein